MLRKLQGTSLTRINYKTMPYAINSVEKLFDVEIEMVKREVIKKKK